MGGKFAIGGVNRLLRDETYIGRAYYNRFDSRNRVPRPKGEWITIQVPPYRV